VVIVSIKTERKMINSAWLDKREEGKKGNRKGRKKRNVPARAQLNTFQVLKPEKVKLCDKQPS
jgi:hypothetical protein